MHLSTRLPARLDDARTEALARAAAFGARGPLGGAFERHDVASVEAFLRQYYEHVAIEDLLERDSLDIVGAAMAHWQLAARRCRGETLVRVYTPEVDEHGWESGHTVADVVSEDMPFLVDSVTSELSRHGLGIHLVVHPQLFVRRDDDGTLRELAGGRGDDTVAESWIHVEVDRQGDRAVLEQVRTDLLRVLADVRAAVEDWTRMRRQAVRIADDLGDSPPPGIPEAEVLEARELLTWLADNHFTFLGYREYELGEESGETVLSPVTGTGLGILRDAHATVSGSFSRLPPDVKRKARERHVLILTKANSRATVHRPAYLDYVGVKRFDPKTGEVTGERRFLGLFSSATYNESVARIPVLRRKVADVLERGGFGLASHSGRDVQQILETYPRDELFQISADDLYTIVSGVLGLQERRQVKLFVRRDDYGRYLSCLVYLPRDRYTTQVRLRMQQILLQELHGTSIDYTTWVSESVLARLHFVVRTEPGALPDVDVDDIQRKLSEATRSWNDDLADAITERCGEQRAALLLPCYSDAFPEAYKEDFPARTAVADLERLEELEQEADFALLLYAPVGAARGERRFKVYRVGPPMSLSQVMPILERLGVEVVDERPYEIDRPGAPRAWIYDFGLRTRGGDPGDDVRELFQDAFAAAWRGSVENDGFNALVLGAGLAWPQVALLRAYAKYLRQAGARYSQHYIEVTLNAHPDVAALLVRLFETRFDPRGPDRRGDREAALTGEIERRLDEVESLDEDRILRSYLSLVRATLRTNYFQRLPDGDRKPYLSLKFDPRAVPDLPLPRPRFEVFVYSPRVEGVHLRFGPIARGGIRWSDRREDFRTEILGLVKAQMVKNAVIVPVGAKGGFVVKQPPVTGGREALMSEVVACYRMLIRGLLDLTDNLVAGAVAPPRDVVRHDADDAYLVVAADKGTATFSDIANEISQEYGFWLGDACASGGSVGYDHKAMGITARGAWESVKRHFRELGVDVSATDFTVAGIGDMSGDVFGNGMLLSPHIRLLAAFDHRHVFLDPSPDAAASHAERQRLFALPRSSWADYDPSLLSPGGGVWPRSAKSIPLSPQAAEVLGLEPGGRPPSEVIRAILRAPVDLLWNGGIGTYAKASTESHTEVGDKANDAVRVDGRELRCKVVGEGGNLGFTQLGRVEYALAGGRINIDAIDNSAGVDTSDHEVNIKILLDRVVAAGDMTRKQRNLLLAEMTDEIAQLVLRDNYGQNVALANSLAQAPQMLNVHTRHLRALERAGKLDRALEFLPSDAELRRRRQQGSGLTSPELSVLLAYTKITLAEELLESGAAQDAFLRRELYSYFPTPLRETFRAQMDEHPLRREIITTCVVNNMVNSAGTTFVFRLGEETGAPAEDIVRAHSVARVVFDMQRLEDETEALDNLVAAGVQTAIRLEGRRLTERATRWLLRNRRAPLDVARSIEFFGDGVATVIAKLPDLLNGSDAARYAERVGQFTAARVPEDLSRWVAGMVPAFSALDLVEVATATRRPVDEVAGIYYALGERLLLPRLRERIVALPREDRWQTLARAALRDDLYAASAALTADVLTATDATVTATERIDQWWQANERAVERARAVLSDIAAADAIDLAPLSVALREIRALVPARAS